MNTRRHTNVGILILLLAACNIALAAPPVRIESATPSEAEQGTSLSVEIEGSGFDTEDGAVTAVRFLLPDCTEEDRSLCPTGDVIVDEYSVPGRKKIIATIRVLDSAKVAPRDIEVQMTRGRGGKGTTLFSVKEKNTGGPEFTTCTDAYFGKSGICMDMNGGECDLRIGNPERIKLMTEDCWTTETIWLPNTGALNSDANIESPADYKTLTAASGFKGRSVIANKGHRAAVRALNIEIADNVETGCRSNDTDTELESAVRFVLDDKDITDQPAAVDPNRASTLYVNAVHVTTAGGPLCEPIVVARKPIYTSQTFGATNDWKISVEGNDISSGSYTRTGIRFEGFKQQQEINPPRVNDNFIGSPHCEYSVDAVGISYGALIARDFDPSSEALIEGNTVIMSDATGCEPTIGILIMGDSDTNMQINLNNNNVTGGDVGVLIDADGDTDSVNMKGNTLHGTGGVAAVCSNIPVDEKGKPNRISGSWGTDLASLCDIP